MKRHLLLICWLIIGGSASAQIRMSANGVAITLPDYFMYGGYGQLDLPLGKHLQAGIRLGHLFGSFQGYEASVVPLYLTGHYVFNPASRIKLRATVHAALYRSTLAPNEVLVQGIDLTPFWYSAGVGGSALFDVSRLVFLTVSAEGTAFWLTELEADTNLDEPAWAALILAGVGLKVPLK